MSRITRENAPSGRGSHLHTRGVGYFDVVRRYAQHATWHWRALRRVEQQAAVLLLWRVVGGWVVVVVVVVVVVIVAVATGRRPLWWRP